MFCNSGHVLADKLRRRLVSWKYGKKPLLTRIGGSVAEFLALAALADLGLKTGYEHVPSFESPALGNEVSS